MTHKLSSLFIVLTLTIGLAVSAGCGGSSDGGGSGGTVGSNLIMEGTVNITGDREASGNFLRMGFSSQPTCAVYASEGAGASDHVDAPGAFRIPGPVISAPLQPSGDIYASTLRITNAAFDGPGVYVNDEIEEQIQGAIVLEEVPDGPIYYLEDAGKVEDGSAEATINPDGSGSVTFMNIPQDTTGIPTSISGTVTWTCTDG